MDNSLLFRDAAPFSQDLWSKIDAMVVNILKSMLVGRKVIDMVGPLGWGVDTTPLFGFTKVGEASMAKDPVYLPLKEISADAVIRAKHIAISTDTQFEIDLGAVALAAIKLAKAEDSITVLGLLEAASKNTIALGDWNVFGSAFKGVASATAKLLNAGFDPPYALVLNPVKYAELAGSMEQGREELEMVEELVEGGIFQSVVMPKDKVMVLSPKDWNFDMVVGQDAVTAYTGNVGMDHSIRIFETVALRVKLPGAICVLA
ncbi:MAG: family 1 encapsulin nanocompartment shell protein [Anaerolineae bacterium]